MQECKYEQFLNCGDQCYSKCNTWCVHHPEHASVKPDSVNHPSHYTDGKIEVIDYIEDKKLTYHLGNAVKYISRAGKKNPDKYVEDLQKAIWYLQREVDRHGK